MGQRVEDPAAQSLAFRRVMREWVTGVTVLTVRAGDQAHGMTCNSFTSVSVEPPTILVCVRVDSRTHGLVVAAGRFAINLLPASQQGLADRYAGVYGGEAQDRFDDVAHRKGLGGEPLIDGALGWFECRITASHPGRTHTIFVAEVERSEAGDDDASPLVRFRSAYTGLRPP